MADKKKPARKSTRVLKKTQTVRERAEKATEPKKVRRINRAGRAAAKPFKAVHQIGKKEFYLPMPQNKIGTFLNKRRSPIPKYFRESWAEVRQVHWPDWRTTVRLTIAVFIFAILFGLLVAVTDYGLDKVLKQLILK